jgi:hypothetical protein
LKQDNRRRAQRKGRGTAQSGPPRFETRFGDETRNAPIRHGLDLARIMPIGVASSVATMKSGGYKIRHSFLQHSRVDPTHIALSLAVSSAVAMRGRYLRSIRPEPKKYLSLFHRSRALTEPVDDKVGSQQHYGESVRRPKAAEEFWRRVAIA